MTILVRQTFTFHDLQ